MPSLAKLKRRVEKLEIEVAKLMVERGISPMSPRIKKLVDKAAENKESSETRPKKRPRRERLRPKGKRATRKKPKKT